MINYGKRAISFFLCMILLFTDVSLAFATDTNSDNTKSSTQTRYMVLALDVSGSMTTEAMTVMKASATSFCDTVEEADNTNYYVALVSYGSSATKVADFTSDMDVIRDGVNGLRAYGGTSFSAALNMSKDLLDNVADPNATKTLLLLSDGLPNAGATSSTGQYTYSDYSSYRYANAAYDIAQSMHSTIDIYTLGFFHSLSNYNKSFAARFMKDIANKSYINVESVDDLEFAFDDFSDDLSKVNLKLSKSNLDIKNGEKFQLEVLPIDGNIPQVYWEVIDHKPDKTDSTEKKVISTTQNGIITAWQTGTATVKVMLKDGSAYALCDVQVSPAATSNLDLWGLSNLVYEDLSLGKLKNATYYDNDEVFYSGSLSYVGTLKQNDFYQNQLGEFRVICTNKENSGFYGAAFLTPDNKIVIAYRGSNDFFDWVLTNTGLFSDANLTLQFDQALELYEKIETTYKNIEIILTGHSLGGALATYVSIMTDAKAITYNGAGGLVLEDTYARHIDDISTFSGFDQWNFVNRYNEDDWAVGAQNANWYKTISHEDNGKGSGFLWIGEPHDRVTFLNTDAYGNISLSTGNQNNSYYSKTWARGYFNLLSGGTVHLTNSSQASKTIFATDSDENIFYSSGNFTLFGSNSVWTFGGDDTFILKDGDTAVGKKGNDEYIIHETGDFTITITDSAGKDKIYLNNYSKGDVKLVSSKNAKYTFELKSADGTIGTLIVDSNRSTSKSDYMRIYYKNDEYTNVTDFTVSPTSFTLATDDDIDAFSITQITGNNLTVSILDEDKKVLGTYSSPLDTVSANLFGYVYPMDNGLELEVMNSGKYISITEGTDISVCFYGLENDSSKTLMQEFTVDLTSNESAFINTYLDATGDENNFYYVKSDNSTEEITTTDYEEMTSLTPSTDTISLKTGESNNISIDIAPSNVVFDNLEFNWTTPTGDASSIVAVSREDDGTYTITGIDVGEGTLTISSLDGSNLTEEISVTVTQDSAPTVTMTSNGVEYTTGTWADSDVMVTASSEGYMSIYTMSGISTETAPTIATNGKTTVTFCGYNETTGALTASTSVEIWVDKEAPEITGVENGGEYYIGKKVKVSDRNYHSATINGSAFTDDDYFDGKMISAVGTHTVTAKDESGKVTSLSFEIKELPSADSLTGTEAEIALVEKIRDDFMSTFNDFTDVEQVDLEEKITALEDKLAQLADPTNGDNKILTFFVNGQVGSSVTYSNAKRIEIDLPSSVMATPQVPYIVTPKGTSIALSNGDDTNTPQDFSQDVTYTVTAINGDTADWTIRASTIVDNTAPEVDGYTVSGNTIMLEFNDNLETMAAMAFAGITLTNMETNESITATSISSMGTAVVIVFDESLHDIAGNYTLHIPAGAFKNVGTTPNLVIDQPIEITNVKTEVSFGVPVTNITVSPAVVNLDLGAGDTTAKLTAQVLPENASVRTYVWSSTDTSVATVDTFGNVTALKAGEVIITATASDGSGVTGTSTVTVTGSEVPEEPSATYTITFNANGGSVSTSSSTTSTSGKLSSLPTPTRSNYSFDGWYTASSGGTKVTTSTVFESDDTIYAQWTYTGSSSSGGSSSGGNSSSSGTSGGSSSTTDTTTDVEDESDTETTTPDALIELPVIREMSSNTFIDLDTTAWYYEAVKYCYDRELMSGTGNGKFSPDMDTSRAMIVQVLYNIAGQPTATGTSFSDVATDSWFANAVAWASSVGVASGTGNGKFSPDGDMTREQLVVMLYGFEKLMTGESYTGSTALSFNDTNSFNNWGLEATAWAVSKGIVAGKPNGGFDPQATATRAEVAQILMNFVELYS